MNWNVIRSKFLKGAASGALGALATLRFTGLTPTGAIMAVCTIVGGAAFNSGFEAVSQLFSGTVATRIDTDGNPNPAISPLTSQAAIAKPNYPAVP